MQHRSDSVEVTQDGLQFWVDDFWDRHGGGFLGFDEFLEGGPEVDLLVRGMPPAIREEIRHHLVTHLLGREGVDPI